MAEIRVAENAEKGLLKLKKLHQHAKPLAGVRITGCMALTNVVAVLVDTLTALGADVRWCSNKPSGTHNHVAAAVAHHGMAQVFCWGNMAWDDFFEGMDRALSWPDGRPPHIILDSGN